MNFRSRLYRARKRISDVEDMSLKKCPYRITERKKEEIMKKRVRNKSMGPDEKAYHMYNWNLRNGGDRE